MIPNFNGLGKIRELINDSTLINVSGFTTTQLHAKNSKLDHLLVPYAKIHSK